MVLIDAISILRIIAYTGFVICLLFVLRAVIRGNRTGKIWPILAGVFLVLSVIVTVVPRVQNEAIENQRRKDMSGNAEIDLYASARMEMVDKDIKGRGISDQQVLEAMGNVKRHLFVSENLWDFAYGNHPLPIDEGQTISQPYIVAIMTEALELKPGERVLEIGTGSGYQAAVLAELTDEVYSIEIKELLVERARANLDANGYLNVKTKLGDGYFGWEENAPYDAIIITCAVNHIPTYLLKQLKDGGRLILPLGEIKYYQKLTLITRMGEDMMVTHIGDVRFVPMTGEALKGE